MGDRMSELRWGTLLLLLVCAILLEPLIGTSRIAELASLALFETSVLGAIFMSAETRRVQQVGFVLAVTWFAASVIAVLEYEVGRLVAWLSVILVFGALTLTFRNMMRRGQSDMDTLLGAIFGYLLLAMAWAMLYVQIERWWPGSFSVPEQSDIWASMLYYSLVTLTTLGYGDVLPVSDIARMAAGFEAVVGVLYIAVMVGSIVSGLHDRRTEEHPDPPA
ncbi:potassium channel family protein [Tropicimonas sp. TH_r6]|uniref:potassium channel family protein n=1 Tax=Tropicimonas sp. TH_r6 TaxID=3082085 RepID=UPI0029545305|nr:potassium channel family protein [Tropicimonas sp. TH_r6]MDV7144421.1 potassium channel family protein [Tropicimonas sp. TH_r6]